MLKVWMVFGIAFSIPCVCSYKSPHFFLKKKTCFSSWLEQSDHHRDDLFGDFKNCSQGISLCPLSALLLETHHRLNTAKSELFILAPIPFTVQAACLRKFSNLFCPISFLLWLSWLLDALAPILSFHCLHLRLFLPFQTQIKAVREEMDPNKCFSTV